MMLLFTTKLHCQVRTDRIGGSWASRGLPRPDRTDRQKRSCRGRTDRLGGSRASRDRNKLTHSFFIVVSCAYWGGTVSELSLQTATLTDPKNNNPIQN